MNETGITPLGHRVLVRPIEVEQKSEGGIITHTDTTARRDQMAQDVGLVVEVADDAWSDQTSQNWAKPGDRVVYAKYAGNVWRGKDGVMYRLVNDLDIIARLDGEVSHG